MYTYIHTYIYIYTYTYIYIYIERERERERAREREMEREREREREHNTQKGGNTTILQQHTRCKSYSCVRSKRIQQNETFRHHTWTSNICRY